MNAHQQELFDLAILRVLDANRTHYGLTVAAISHLMAQFGFPSPDAEDVAERLEYLVKNKLAQEVTKLIGKANRTWKLTEAGFQYVDTHA